MKKKLPKATSSTLSEIHSESVNASAKNDAKPAIKTSPKKVATTVPAPRPRKKAAGISARKKPSPKAAPDTSGESADTAASKITMSAAEVPPTPVTALVPATQARNSNEPESRQPSELRQAQALVIVGRYTTYSALGGCIPLVIFDAISVSAIVFNMVRALAEHYHVPFQRDRVKAGVAALLTGVASPSLGSIATHLAGRLIPGAWLLSTAVSSASAATLTRYIGQAFIAHLESGGTTLNFDMAHLMSGFRKTAAA